MNRRVVVTGLGVVSAIGIGKDAFWNNLIKGKSGISKVTLFDTSRYNRHYAGEIKNFNPEDFIPRRMFKFFGRASQFAIAATKLALDDANVPLRTVSKKENICVIIGTTMPEDRSIDFSSENMSQNTSNDIDKANILSIFPSRIVQNLCDLLKIRGKALLIPNACAAGNYTIAYGFDLVRNGKTDMAIVGGTEALSRIAFQGFQTLGGMAPEICSPFDKNREGMILAEGAGILIMEPMENALERKTKIYAEVLGYGISSDASNMTIPKKEGVKKAMEKALKNSNVSPNDIDYISAHGTGTPANDKIEIDAIKELFRQRYNKIPMSSIKSMLGHSMGAASSIEAIACCLSIQNDIIPPTINFNEPDHGYDIDFVPNKARKSKITTVLNNAFAFGGVNCCVIFNQYN